MQVADAAQARRFGFADGGGLVEAEHGGSGLPFRQRIGNQQIGRDAIRFSLHHLADKGDLPAPDLGQPLGFQNLNLQRVVRKLGKRPHHLLHVLQDMGSTNGPVVAALDRMRLALAVQVVKQVPLVPVDGGFRGRASGQPEEHQAEAEPAPCSSYPPNPRGGEGQGEAGLSPENRSAAAGLRRIQGAGVYGGRSGDGPGPVPV